ncbi:MAG: hypothetical protein Q4C91_13685 [Eubacteriales bacterium]|nr:hypothetical protein [Eubacteriales bacterium]
MLNNDYKEQAIRDLKKIDHEYTTVFKKTVNDMERLQSTRKITVRTIQCVERYIISLANRPRNFDTKISENKIRYLKFEDTCRKILEIEQKKEGQQAIKGIGTASALAGAGIAALGPTAAMAIATTFGTASTGTAIASLSGAAATNAALAWLGGGALAAGGAGMAAGEMFLAMTGPIGWAIGGISLTASLVAVNLSNKEIAKKTEKSIAAIKKEIERIKEIDIQVLSWNNETKALSNGIMNRLNYIRSNRKRDYQMFTDDEMNELISIMNSTEVLSKLLGKTIEEK